MSARASVEEIYANASPTVRASLERQGLVKASSTHSAPGSTQSSAHSPAGRAPGAADDDGRMNKTEAAYEAEVLIPATIRGEVLTHLFEPVKFRLGKGCFYAPDFLVVEADGRLVFHEVKGRPGSGPGGWRDDARVKIKVAAEKYGRIFGFVGAARLRKKDGGGWHSEVFA